MAGCSATVSLEIPFILDDSTPHDIHPMPVSGANAGRSMFFYVAIKDAENKSVEVRLVDRNVVLLSCRRPELSNINILVW